MKLQETKQIFKNWNKYNSILTEVTEDELSLVQAAVDKATNNPSVLPFNDQFEGKLRTVVNIAYNPYTDPGIISTMLNTLVAAGWKVDLNSGIASKQFEKEFEGVNRVQTRQMKVNAIWTSLSDLLIKYQKEFDTAYDAAPDDIVKVPESPELDRLQSQIFTLMGKEVGTRFVSIDIKKVLPEIQSYIKLWQKQAARIKGKIDNKSLLSVVMSRHPVDVFRMSDFANITSCHAPPSTPTGPYRGGGSYYKCTVAEARDGGAISFLVNTEDIEGIDLEQKDIFTDKTRGFSGVTPIARLRLRAVVNKEANISLAIPEERLYGDDIVGFRETVTNWAISSQASQFQKAISLAKGGVLDLDKFERLGGDYEDHTIDNLFSKLISKIPALSNIRIIGRIPFNATRQKETNIELGIEEDLEVLADAVIIEFNETSARNNLNLRCADNWYVLDNSINPEVHFIYTIDQTKTKSGWVDKLSKLRSYFISEFEDYALEKYCSANPLFALSPINFNKESELKFPIDELSFSEEGRYITSIEILEQVLFNMKVETYKNQSQLNQIIDNFLTTEGVYEGGVISMLNHDILNGDVASDWELNAIEEVTESTSVEAELSITIEYSELGLNGRQANKAIKQKLINKIALNLQEQFKISKNPHFYFDIIWDLEIEELLIFLKIDIGRSIPDSISKNIINMIQVQSDEIKARIVEIIIKNLGTEPATPMTESKKINLKTNIEQFKYVTNKWKNFLI